MMTKRCFKKCTTWRAAVAAKETLGTAINHMANNGEFRLVRKETAVSEIGTENIAYWDEFSDDAWLVLVQPTAEELNVITPRWKYEIHGSGMTAQEALIDYIHIPNQSENEQPDFPANSSPEERLLRTIFIETERFDAEKARIKRWLFEAGVKEAAT